MGRYQETPQNGRLAYRRVVAPLRQLWRQLGTGRGYTASLLRPAREELSGAATGSFGPPPVNGAHARRGTRRGLLGIDRDTRRGACGRSLG